MVTVVVLTAVGLFAGALLLVALALSVRAAQVGRTTRAEDGLPLVGARHAQFGDATAAARCPRARPLRLVRPPSGGEDQPQRPVRAA